MDNLGNPSQQRLSKMLFLAGEENEKSAIAAFLLARGMMAKHAVEISSLIRSADEVADGICEKSYERLRKLLTLTASDKEGEAIAAFLMARRLMQKLNLSFEIVLKLPSSTELTPYKSAYPTPEMEALALRKKVRRLQMELADANAKVARYEKAFDEMVANAWSLNFTGDEQNTPRLN